MIFSLPKFNHDDRKSSEDENKKVYCKDVKLEQPYD